MTDFFNMSFRLGQVSGINIRVHILFVVWIAFQLLTAGEAWAQVGLFLGLLFGIVLLHEFGHCFGARAVGGWADNILMWPLGGLAFAHAPMTPWAQFVTLACGPLVNLIFCLVSGAYLVATTGTTAFVLLNPFGGLLIPPPGLGFLGFMLLFYQVNLLLLAFNLLPIYPLDGGQLLGVFLWPLLGLQRATEIACQLGLVGCAGLFLWALSGDTGPLLMFIAIFGAFSCYQRLQMARMGMIVDERVRFAPVKTANRRSWWSRWRRRRAAAAQPEPERAQPGAWERRMSERRTRDEEIDRILAKVSREGIGSLTYTERQALERASRERQRRDREFDRQSRL